MKNIIIIALLLSCVSFSGNNKRLIHHENERYKYIETKECTVPILAYFTRIDHDEKKDSYDIRPPIADKSFAPGARYSISRVKYNKPLKETISLMHSYSKLLKGTIRNEINSRGFFIIEIDYPRLNLSTLSYSDTVDTFYMLYGQKYVVLVDHIKKKDVEYLINYCEKTRR